MPTPRSTDDIIRFLSRSKWIVESDDIMRLDPDEFSDTYEHIWESYLAELFDIKTGPEYSIRKAGESYFGVFDLFEEQYRVTISPSKEEGFYYVNLELLNSPDIPRIEDFPNVHDFEVAFFVSRTKLTNRNHPLRVLSTAISFVYDFMVKVKPRGVVFSDIDQGKRKILYSELAKRLANKTGYVVLPHKDPNIYVIASEK